MNQPRIVNRTQLASWAGVAGTTALVLGGLVYLIEREISALVFAFVVSGAAGIVLWMALAPDDLRSWLSGRQTRYGTTSIVITLVFIGTIAYTYVLFDRANLTADLTQAQRYSLNPPSFEAIKQLRERDFRVRIVGFFTRNKLREQESADLLMRQYEAESGGMIDIQYIDPDEQPDLAAQYNYQPGLDGQFVLTILGPDGTPRLRDAVSDSGNVERKYFTLFLGRANERDITTGLKTVASAGTFKIYFTIGHGERVLSLADDNGISRLFVSLDGQGIAVEELDLQAIEAIPHDASAVLIVGALDDFSQAEVDRLDDYIQRGGRIGIFADPPLVESAVVGATGNTFLSEGGPLSQYLWNTFGVRVRDALAIETKPELVNGSEWIPIINTVAPHTIMRDVRDEPIYARFIRTIDLVETPTELQNRYVREPLLFTSELSFAETNLEGFLEARVAYDPQQDIPGPLLVGVTVQRQLEFQYEQQPRLVIIGDSDIVKNEYVKQIPGNVFLWTDIVDWLTGFAETVSFTPTHDPTLLKLAVSSNERNTIAVITMIILPGMVLVTGALVWWYRHR